MALHAPFIGRLITPSEHFPSILEVIGALWSGCALMEWATLTRMTRLLRIFMGAMAVVLGRSSHLSVFLI